MNPDSTKKRRNLTLFTVGVALLVLTGWVVTAWVPKGSATESNPTISAADTMESDDVTESSAPQASRRREAQATDNQIRGRVEAMLRIKSNEVAIVIVPKAALDQCFRQSSLQTPSLRGLVSKGVLKTCLEGVIKDGGPVKVMVGEDQTTEYTTNGIQVRVKVTGKTDTVSNVEVETTGNGSDLRTELDVFPGHSLVFGLPAPAEVGIVILVGNDLGRAPANTQP